MINSLKKHQYSCVDTSPFSNYVMNPFWNYIVQFCPKYIAPNLLTVAGFLLTVSNFLMLSYYDPNFRNMDHIPRPVWLWSAFFTFAAHTLDGIDGKQARRLGLSSPLGELLDHSFDSWTAVFLPASLSSMFVGYLSPVDVFYVQWVILFTFLLSHWEKSITGILYLPWSCDIGQIFSVVLFVVTYIYSPTVWSYPIPIFHVTFPEIIPYGTMVFLFIFTLPISVFNVWLACRGGRAPWPTLNALLRPLLGTIIVFVTSLVWLICSPTSIFDKFPRLFIFCCGTLCSHVTTRVIVSDISKSDPPILTLLTTLYSTACVSLCFCLPHFIAITLELPVLCILSSVFVIMHFSYLVSVVNEMCSIFNVRALVV